MKLKKKSWLILSHLDKVSPVVLTKLFCLPPSVRVVPEKVKVKAKVLFLLSEKVKVGVQALFLLE